MMMEPFSKMMTGPDQVMAAMTADMGVLDKKNTFKRIAIIYEESTEDKPGKAPPKKQDAKEQQGHKQRGISTEDLKDGQEGNG